MRFNFVDRGNKMDKEKNKNQEKTSGDFISEADVKAQEEKKPAKKTKKSGKPGFFKRIGLKIKDVFSELKRVTWPTFPKVVKQTGVVLVVVLLFLVVITAFDFGLFELLKLVVPE